jgi:hypothetical protein
MSVYTFYKENGIWYIDLPEYLELGLGTTANLMMVDGSDTFLDFLSKNGEDIHIAMSPTKFEGYDYQLVGEKQGLNKRLLKLIGHAPVDYGKYYTVKEHNDHRLWLCPVTEFVFGNMGDGYPDNIYIKIV